MPVNLHESNKRRLLDLFLPKGMFYEGFCRLFELLIWPLSEIAWLFLLKSTNGYDGLLLVGLLQWYVHLTCELLIMLK